MGTQSFIPELWAALISKAFEKALVYGSCANTDYEGTIAAAGDKVRILELGDVTVSPYVKGTTEITYQELEDASKYLLIDQSKYFAFKVDDVDTAQANPKLIGPGTAKAAYAVADTVDQYLASLYTKAGITANLGTTGTPIEINSANVLEYLRKMARLLDDNKIPRSGRFVVVPPWFVEDLAKADTAISTSNVDTLVNGLVGRSCGFDVKMSVNVPNTTSTKYMIIAGTNAALSFASQVAKTEALRLEGSFATAIRGLYLYGAEVLHPDGLACLVANEAAEA